VTNTMRGIGDKNNKLSFRPVCRGHWSDLAKDFTGSLVPHTPIPVPSFVQILDIGENVFQTHYNIANNDGRDDCVLASFSELASVTSALNRFLTC